MLQRSPMQKILKNARLVTLVLALGVLSIWAGEFSHLLTVDHHYCEVHHTWEHEGHAGESHDSGTAFSAREEDEAIACKTCGQLHQSTFLQRIGFVLLAQIKFAPQTYSLEAKVLDFSDRQLSRAPKNSPPAV